MTEQIWFYIDRIGQILGLIAFLPILYSAWSLFVIRRRQRIIYENIRKEPGEKPGVLIVDSMREGDKSIQPQVENWLWSQPNFKTKIGNTKIELVEFSGYLKSSDMPEINRKIRKGVGSLQSQGITKSGHYKLSCFHTRTSGFSLCRRKRSRQSPSISNLSTSRLRRI